MFDFLKNPSLNATLQNLTYREKIQNLFWVFLSCLVFQVLVGICIMVPIDAAVKKFYDYSILDVSKQLIPRAIQKFGSIAFFILAILGPFLEEVIFRLPLKLEKFGIGLSLGLLSYYFSGTVFEISFYEWTTYLRLVVSAMIIIAVHKFLPARWLDIVKTKFYKQYFYLAAILFALVHIPNYAPYNCNLLFLYPIFTLPQFVMGVFIGYIRVKYGFFFGWYTHALINSLAFLGS